MARWNYHQNKCRFCKTPLKQPKTGRTRLTCSNACRHKIYRLRRGGTTRQHQKLGKSIERRRARPFIDRTFHPTYFEEVWVLSQGRKVYECMACGEPYIVERLWNGNPPRKYCSDACEKKTKYHWRRFDDAYERAHQQGKLTTGVRDRADNYKLSPLCPVCGIPFDPKMKYGRRKRGRPRKYCSDACRKAAYERRWKTKHKRARVHRYRDCAECGEKFDRTDSLGRRRMRYCSDACKDRAGSRKYRASKKKSGSSGVVEQNRRLQPLGADFRRAEEAAHQPKGAVEAGIRLNMRPKASASRGGPDSRGDSELARGKSTLCLGSAELTSGQHGKVESRSLQYHRVLRASVQEGLAEQRDKSDGGTSSSDRRRGGGWTG